MRNQNLLRNVLSLAKFRGSAVIFHDNSIIFINFVTFRNEFLSRFTNDHFFINAYWNSNNNINEKIMTFLKLICEKKKKWYVLNIERNSCFVSCMLLYTTAICQISEIPVMIWLISEWTFYMVKDFCIDVVKGTKL